MAASDVMLTIVAPAGMSGTACWRSATGATTLTSNAVRMSASDVRSSVVIGRSPSVLALLTTRWIAPRRAASAISTDRWEGSVTSPAMLTTVVRRLSSSTAASRRSRRRASMTSVQPRPASPRARARPSPCDAPVMTATRSIGLPPRWWLTNRTITDWFYFSRRDENRARRRRQPTGGHVRCSRTTGRRNVTARHGFRRTPRRADSSFGPSFAVDWSIGSSFRLHPTSVVSRSS